MLYVASWIDFLIGSATLAAYQLRLGVILMTKKEKGEDHPVVVGLKTYFFAGVIVTAPIAITIYLTWIFLSFIDSRVTALIPPAYNPFNYVSETLFGIHLLKAIISLALAILFFILVGWFARNVLGRLLYKISEYVLHQMPVINNVYKGIKQIFETIMATQSDAFRDVVMMEYPRKGIWSLGFVTGKSKGEVQRMTANETINVFVPTTPNPTSGFLLFVPVKEVTYMDMTVEEAAKLIVSAGIITPPDRDVLEQKSSGVAKKVAPKKAAPKKAATKKGAPKKASAAKKKVAPKKKAAAKSVSGKKANKK